ncbi:MAG: SEC-C metal-binding domain-containing protein, partial [Actinomycetota bacterium]
EGLDHAIAQLYPSKLPGTFDAEAATYETVFEEYLEEAQAYYAVREEEIGDERFRELERLVLLSILNARWREHLYEMDQLREGIGLRAYGQRDPLTEYQREAFDMFGAMMDSLKEEFVRYMFHVQVVEEPKPQAQPVSASRAAGTATAMQSARAEAGLAGTSEGFAGEPARTDKVPRNAPCPCGSGKKYKLCHGREV